jgi:hypothetical protein
MKFISKLIWPMNIWLAANLKATTDDNEVVVKTSRYLRLSMIGMVVGLGASVVFELVRVRNKDNGKGCLLDSISAYYYTPVHAFFVGALVTIGVCLFAIKGNTHFEDLLLNFAGLFAPLVALVPTNPAPTSCGVTLGETDRELNIANNVGAFLILGFAAVVLLGVLGAIDLLRHDQKKKPSLLDFIGFSGTAVFFIGTLLLFWRNRPWFLEHTHNYSAITMFVLIGINVLINGYNLYQTRAHPHPANRLQPGVARLDEVSRFNRYVNLGILMVVAAAFILLVIKPRWRQWNFALEATEIVLFAIFWVLQTVELWHQGLRPKVAESALPARAG